MKCESCLELLEEYLDGELADRESREIAMHLATCSACASATTSLSSELELFSRYDRELEVPASCWEQIAERTSSPVIVPVSNNGFGARLASLFRVPAIGFSLATAAVLLVIALVIVAAYMRSRKPDPSHFAGTEPTPSSTKPDEKRLVESAGSKQAERKEVVRSFAKPRPRKSLASKSAPIDQSDVLSTDLGYPDLDDRDTAKHIEQTQNLLRSIRNVQLNDTDQEIDVSYDKALSRRLLNENIVLRRDAEMKAKFPTKSLLSDLEPFLIDIANLPDQAKPDDLRAIKERVQKKEIVAALIGY
jgi:hypothetical protein